MVEIRLSVKTERQTRATRILRQSNPRELSRKDQGPTSMQSMRRKREVFITGVPEAVMWVTAVKDYLVVEVARTIPSHQMV